MDGHFVPNISIGPPVVKSLRAATNLFLDVHLMIENPDRYIEAFVNAGADNITVHVETCGDLPTVIKSIKDKNIKAGITLKPDTPLSTLDSILEQIDLVLIMAVHPGFGGQKFIPESLDRISQIRAKLDSRNLTHVNVEVDGGVGIDNINMISDAGADILVAGSAVFGSKNPSSIIKEMLSLVND